MSPRLRSLHGHAEMFARATLTAEATALDVFDQVWARGASGLDCPVRLDAAGRPVLSEPASYGSRLRRRPVAALAPDQLPPSVAPLAEVVARSGPGCQFLLDVADDVTLEAVLATVRAVRPAAEPDLWLCSPSLEQLVSWRLKTRARLVNAIRLGSTGVSPEQRMNQLAERSIDALCLPHGEWSGGLIALAHRFDRLALARGAEHEREVATVLDTGIDGVSCSHVDRLMAVAALYYPQRYPAR